MVPKIDIKSGVVPNWSCTETDQPVTTNWFGTQHTLHLFKTPSLCTGFQ